MKVIFASDVYLGWSEGTVKPDGLCGNTDTPGAMFIYIFIYLL